MKNKKGFLLAEETLKIVIALIAISFLIYFLSSLYFNSQNEKELELAKASLEHLIKEVNSISEGKPKDVGIYNPKGLWLMSWPDQTEKIMPDSCKNFGWENCICICDNPGVKDLIIDFFTSHTQIASYADKCDEKGVCKQLTEKIIVGDSIKQYALKIVDPPMIIEIKNDRITKK
tara:strand:+ start:5372 stop:5896 length:525 start_codon:yes stop_codon:yes gene_type:complete